MKSLSEHIILVSPIGAVDAGLVRRIRARITEVFGYATDVKRLLSDANFSFDARRDQYNSTQILQKLDTLAPPGTQKVIAITHVDLFIPILTYVYGEAQLGGKACIISTHRLHEAVSPMAGEKAFYARLAKEAIHELGHTFDIRHCPEPTCIMHYCRSIDDVDRKSDQLCHYCKVLLEDEKKRLLECGSGPGARL